MIDPRRHAEIASSLLDDNENDEANAPVALAHALTAIALVLTQDSGDIPVVLPYPIDIQQ